MAKYAVELFKEHPYLSQMEAETLLSRLAKNEEFEIDGNLLIFETDEKKDKILEVLEKLAYSRKAILILQNAKNGLELIQNLEKNGYLESVEFPKNGSFKISIELISGKKKDLDVIKLAKLTYDLSGITNIDLKKPDIEFIIFAAKQSYYGEKIWKNSGKFLERRADKRPEPHPTSMNPKLSRAMINLANPKKEVLDPFCGSGGTLIEAGIMGLKLTGIDIDSDMIKRAKKNFEHYGLQKYDLIEGDALSWNKKAECVVTDVPYGRSSKLREELKGLVEKFLDKYINLTDTVVMAFPDYIDAEKMAKSAGWSVKSTFSIYIHSTLTRKIMVLKK